VRLTPGRLVQEAANTRGCLLSAQSGHAAHGGECPLCAKSGYQPGYSIRPLEPLSPIGKITDF
jgi:hypothetical protein